MTEIVPKKKLVPIEPIPPRVLDRLQTAITGIIPKELFELPLVKLNPSPVGNEETNARQEVLSFTDMLQVGDSKVAVVFHFDLKRRECNLRWVLNQKLVSRPMTIAEKDAGLAHARRRVEETQDPVLRKLVKAAEWITNAEIEDRIKREKA